MFCYAFLLYMGFAQIVLSSCFIPPLSLRALASSSTSSRRFAFLLCKKTDGDDSLCFI
ncbi:hypothetical protein P154DRAFT_294367 [Amniculicola lignicola CBS 123094]|uniref:Uncharacterized protein n=1 Tax=Amniculicola lignicola CBS 123094 TaxID=1392246 RepID=A0A6A5W8Y5_9PLEO|nr:hypothetical protein P154DRAFT_294367 [Amniculicola lignicola CBS 123094]